MESEMLDSDRDLLKTLLIRELGEPMDPEAKWRKRLENAFSAMVAEGQLSEMGHKQVATLVVRAELMRACAAQTGHLSAGANNALSDYADALVRLLDALETFH